MSRDERERLNDIEDAIAAIRSHLARSATQDTSLLHDALLFQFVVIGEAVKHLDPDARARAPRFHGPTLPGSEISSHTSTSGSAWNESLRSAIGISRGLMLR